MEVITFRMEQSGMTAKDLVPCIGPLNRVKLIRRGDSGQWL